MYFVTRAIVLTLLFSFTLVLSAQEKTPSISLHFSGVSIERVFEEIKSQTGLSFIYTKEQLQSSKPVTIQVSAASLEKVLTLCFEGQPFTYTRDEKYIIVKDPEKSTQPVQPETISILGRVLTDNKKPIPGATISVVGSKLATASTERGDFVLRGLVPNAVIEVSSIGYETQVIQVDGKKSLIVILKQIVSTLDETIVIAYGNTTKRVSTGNIGKVTATEIERQPVSNPLATIDGRIPGVVVTQVSGVPGAPYKMEIRGRTSVGTTSTVIPVSNDPLFIIDGVPFSPGNKPVNQFTSLATSGIDQSAGGISPFSLINPADIESIEILKDADATAIYGSRGSNGVVLITTKKGLAGRLKTSFNFTQGFSKATRTLKFMNTQQYLAMRREAFANDGAALTTANAYDLLTFDTSKYTDFTKLFLGGTASNTSAQVTMQGGTVGCQFIFGTTFNRETTIFPGDMSDNKVSFHSSISHESRSGRFKINLTVNYNVGKNNLAAQGFSTLFTLPPNHPDFIDANGNLVWQYKGRPFAANPYAYLKQSYLEQSTNLGANFQFSFRIWKQLRLKTSIGYNAFSTDETTKAPSSSQNPSSGAGTSFSSFGNSDFSAWIIEPQLEYIQEWKKHALTILTGSSFQKTEFKSMQITGYNFPNDALLGNLASAATIGPTVNNFSDYRYEGVFGRLTYNYAKKYLANLSVRRDGSSRFGPDNRFSNFGSLGMAWVFSRENFIFRALKALSYGKLRASFGISGNDKIGDYQYLNTWSSTNTYNGSGTLFPTGLSNPSYRWEITQKWETGIDLGFFNDRILVSGVYYRNSSDNQLVQYKQPIQAGATSVIANFPAQVCNTGWEFEASAQVTKGKRMQWKTSVNFSTAHNRLLAFPGIENSSYNNLVVGEPLSVYGGLHFLGVNPSTGLYEFAALDGVSTSTPSTSSKDRIRNLGNTEAKFYGGWSNSINFKNFSIDIFLNFRKWNGTNYLYQLAVYRPGTINNLPPEVLNRWQKPGDVAPFQQFSQSASSAAYKAAGVFLSVNSEGKYGDASFIRLKNLAFTYTLPAKLISKLKANEARLFIRTQNLFTISGYKGADPESQNVLTAPPLKTIVFGCSFAL